MNKSGYNINLKAFSLEHGQWVKGYNLSCEPQTDPLANGHSEVFSSIPDSNYDNSMYGIAIFVIDDDKSSTLIISWGNFSVNYYILSKGYNVKVQSIYEEDSNVTYQQLTVHAVHHNNQNFWNSFPGSLLFMLLSMYCCCLCLISNNQR